jgi:membrane-associated phospholipid phosphatase
VSYVSKHGWAQRASLLPTLAGWAIGIALLSLAATARADDPPPVGAWHWDPAWTHAGPVDYGLTIFALEDIVPYELFAQSKQPPLHWTGPILFDSAVRNLLRGATQEVRDEAGTASWIGFGAVIGYTVIDLPYSFFRFGNQAGWDLFWMDGSALALSTMIDLNVRDVVGRARPDVYACMASGGSAASCLGTSSESTRSFPGGHVAMVTTAAALTCTQHLSLHLYGSPWDEIACGASVSGDVAVGVLRIVADAHWASDILVGAGLGLAIGWGLPVAMHLHGGEPDTSSRLAPYAVPLPHGAQVGFTRRF